MPLYTLGTSPLGSRTLGGGRVITPAAPATTGPYFPPGYFSALGGLAGIGYPAGVAYPTAGGYWPGRYWPGTYFAPTYWPARPVELRAAAGTFLAAVRGALLDDAPLVAMTPGGVWKDRAPRGTRLPFIVNAEVNRVPTYQSAGPNGRRISTELVTFDVSVYANSGALASTIGERIRRALDDVPLVYAGGVVLEVRHDQSAMTVIDPSSGYGGADVWHHILPFYAVVLHGTN